MADPEPLRFYVPEPAVRPGDEPDFSNVKIAEAGSVARPPIDVDPESIRDHAYSIIRVLNRRAEAVGPWAGLLSDGQLLEGLRDMLVLRAFDARMLMAQRQGKTSFYMQHMGEEAVSCAFRKAQRKGDMNFPTYRQTGLLIAGGYPVFDLMCQIYSNERDPLKGRQMPVHHSANWLNLVSISSPVGTQIPQAVGSAYAAKLLGKDDVSMVYFGEGTSSTGEFHVGMNFAGVWKAPCVFICRNNGWAISVPREKQTAAKTFASKAVGYGMPGIRVDGNDILAMLQVAGEAIDRARAGDGPTMIEALTYRVQGHSSSDDPSVYRDPKEPELWERRDPLNRLRNYLRHRTLWDESWERELTERYNQEITDALAAADKLGAPPLESMFEDVYEDMPWHLQEQKAWLLAQARTRSPHFHG